MKTQEKQTKWQPLTRGGFEYYIYEEFEGAIYGRVKSDNYRCYISMMWDSDGKYFGNPETGKQFDLLKIETIDKNLQSATIIQEKQTDKKHYIFEFIDWIDKNGFYTNYTKGYLLWGNDRNLYCDKLYTIEELYEIFIKNK